MGEISHTAGPWVVNPFNAQVDCEKPSRHGGLLPIAQMLWPTDERSEAETEANAHLIAAAPDLYEALQALLEYAFDGPPYDSALAALAKATGATQ